MAVYNPTDVEEIWKTIPDFPNYEASNLGRIRRSKGGQRCRAGRVLKPRTTWDGYHQVNLYSNGRPHAKKVHVLIAAVFIGPRPKDMQINHKSAVKLDNRPENLEYVPQSANMKHAFDHGLMTSTFQSGEKHPRAKLIESDVKTIIQLLRNGVSCRVVARQYGVSLATILDISARRTWKHMER